MRLALSLMLSSCPDSSSSVFPQKVTHIKEYCRSYMGKKFSWTSKPITTFTLRITYITYTNPTIAWAWVQICRLVGLFIDWVFVFINNRKITSLRVTSVDFRSSRWLIEATMLTETRVMALLESCCKYTPRNTDLLLPHNHYSSDDKESMPANLFSPHIGHLFNCSGKNRSL